MKVIELKGITRVYDTGSVSVEALRGIDLEVSKGEFLSIMGASGSGKSTLMNILGCLDRPTSGSYLLNGEDVSKHDKKNPGQPEKSDPGVCISGISSSTPYNRTGEC
jgi:putative ABC transport system ATP-binding protein